MTAPARSLRVTTYEGVRAIDPAAWDALLPTPNPTICHAFLSTLEDTGCVGGDTGWQPLILGLLAQEGDKERLVAALPLYLKMNSEGEFVFDWAWADAAHRAGLRYYPKGLVASPFTPAGGARLLVDPTASPDEQRALARALAQSAIDVADSLGLSSLHFNFLHEPDLSILTEDLGLPVRHGIQYHWFNRDAQGQPYTDYDAFLARFRAKRRANLRRERRKLHEQGISTRVVTGRQADAALMDHMFDYYRSTVRKFHWGRQYLNRDFFHAIPSALGDQLHLMLASQNGQHFAGALNLLGGGRLYGRYWGCAREVEFAHFEVCMYSPIQWCIDHGVSVFEPGAGGEHKYERGFTPTLTTSVHYLRDPRMDRAIRAYLAQERAAVARQLDALRDQSPIES
jgi:predicted N-acyltransferase